MKAAVQNHFDGLHSVALVEEVAYLVDNAFVVGLFLWDNHDCLCLRILKVSRIQVRATADVDQLKELLAANMEVSFG